MNNSLFSSLIYRIISNPERWHDDYIEVMHQILDKRDSFDEAYSIAELAAGDKIISQLRESNETLTACNTLLDKSRFKMIILDEQLKPIYHNRNAIDLYNFLLNPVDRRHIKPGLAKQILEKHGADPANKKNTLLALDYFDQNDEQIYLHSTQSSNVERSSIRHFHILMALDQSQHKSELSADLVNIYGFTKKEQMVLRGLIHVSSIKQIAADSFISENTVKTHLKSLFRKTNTHSQSAVVGLILTHESQIMDSYFESDSGATSLADTSSQDREITLRSGHKIAYREYGPADGQPLIVFHSGYGCRLSVPLDYAQICACTNRRLIIPDRPGVGKTPFIRGHPQSWNDRLGEFIDALRLTRFDILGNILGCQLAINFAAQADSRLGKVILASPVVINRPEHTKHLTGILNPSARLVRSSKKFAREIYELWLKSVTLNPERHYRSMLETSLGSAELQKFKQDGTVEHLIDVFREGAGRNFKGISHEMVFCISPLNIPTEKLTFPVEAWYGTEDQCLSLEGAKAILQDFPNHRLEVREGYSESIYYALLEEMIA